MKESDIQEIDEIIRRCLVNGPEYELREAELSMGNSLIEIGEVAWLPADDWMSAVVSRRGKEIRIVAIWAKFQGTGAFKRMIAGILSEGLRPIVVCPFDEMTQIMRHWGWSCQIVGRGLQREERWMPKKKCVPARTVRKSRTVEKETRRGALP